MSKGAPDITKAERAEFVNSLKRTGKATIYRDVVEKYDDSEARDDHGRWTSGGSDSGAVRGGQFASGPKPGEPGPVSAREADDRRNAEWANMGHAPAATPERSQRGDTAGGWKTFSKGDWDGYAGAESFPNGDPPRINNDIKVDAGDGTKLDTTAIIDAHGAQITVYEKAAPGAMSFGEPAEFHATTFDATNPGAVGWLATHATNDIGLKDLTDHGFENILEEDY